MLKRNQFNSPAGAPALGWYILPFLFLWWANSAAAHEAAVSGWFNSLEETLLEIDGVLYAKVHLPVTEQMLNAGNLQYASVFVKHSPLVSTGSLAPVIKQLVANSIQGLEPDRVKVVFSPSQPIDYSELCRGVPTSGTGACSALANHLFLMSAALLFISTFMFLYSLRLFYKARY